MGSLWDFLSSWWFWIDWGTFALAILSIPSVLVQRRRRPLAAVSWILALVSIPFVGVFLWWLIGRRHLARPKRRKRTVHERMQARLVKLRADLDDVPGTSSSLLLQVEHLPAEVAESVFPPTTGNEVVLMDSHEAFDIMERDIRAAKHHVHMLFYIWKNDETGRRFRDLLIEKAQEGVQVRVLCDAVGSPAFATRFVRPLEKAGARVERFLPPRFLSASPRLNFRNHRKVLVVDGCVGMVGGFNMADEYRTQWRDMGVRLRGPAVDQLQEIFAEDWNYVSNEDLADEDFFGCWTDVDGSHAVAAIASGPDSRHSPIEDALFAAITSAQSRIWLTTPYFIPSRSLQTALRAAVFRGVDVRVMVPARSDIKLVRWAARSYYPDLLEVGVRIFEYQPAMLHAKVSLFDDQLAIVGSANLDSRSFRLNFEVSCVVSGRDLNQSLAGVFESDLADCEEISLPGLERLPWTQKLADATANLLSPLL